MIAIALELAVYTLLEAIDDLTYVPTDGGGAGRVFAGALADEAYPLIRTNEISGICAHWWRCEGRVRQFVC